MSGNLTQAERDLAKAAATDLQQEAQYIALNDLGTLTTFAQMLGNPASTLADFLAALSALPDQLVDPSNSATAANWLTAWTQTSTTLQQMIVQEQALQAPPADALPK